MEGTALILAGGGGKGAYEIGVWKAMRELGIDKKIWAVSGASVGGLNGALFVLMVCLFYRSFSKDLSRRRTENQKWLGWYWGMKNRSAGARARHADKAHKYFTCKECRTICRVPVGQGKIIITCPKCGAQIQAKT